MLSLKTTLLSVANDFFFLKNQKKKKKKLDILDMTIRESIDNIQKTKRGVM